MYNLIDRQDYIVNSPKTFILFIFINSFVWSGFFQTLEIVIGWRNSYYECLLLNSLIQSVIYTIIMGIGLSQTDVVIKYSKIAIFSIVGQLFILGLVGTQYYVIYKHILEDKSCSIYKCITAFIYGFSSASFNCLINLCLNKFGH